MSEFPADDGTEAWSWLADKPKLANGKIDITVLIAEGKQRNRGQRAL